MNLGVVPDDLDVVVLRVDDDGAAAAEGHGGHGPLQGGRAPAAQRKRGTAAGAVGGPFPARRPTERTSVAGVGKYVGDVG